MKLRTTHTYAELEVSAAAYDEIAAKLRAAGYDHVFIQARTAPAETIDMTGIGLTRAAGPPKCQHGSVACELICEECGHECSLHHLPSWCSGDDCGGGADHCQCTKFVSEAK